MACVVWRVLCVVCCVLCGGCCVLCGRCGGCGGNARHMNGSYIHTRKVKLAVAPGLFVSMCWTSVLF